MAGDTLAIQTQEDVGFAVLTWDTAYPILTGGVGSKGIKFSCASPKDAAWGMLDRVRASGAVTFAHADTKLTVEDGYTDNLANYWAGGAPGYHGATAAGRVAYHFELHARDAAARAWFGSNTFFFAFGGQGYLRIDGPSGTLFKGEITEVDYLANGLNFTQALDMSLGGIYHVYYVQERNDPWGGFTIKAVPGARGASREADQVRAREAHVVGCGLFDDGTELLATELSYIEDVNIDFRKGATATVTVTLPLLNPQVNDGNGWEFVKADSKDPGYLRLWDGGALADVEVRRGRVIEIRGGYQANKLVVFTGTIDDWDEASSGHAVVKCYGVEQRLLERIDRNLPDRVSYMTHAYRATTTLGEPVYNLPAFDAWPLELAMREMASRGGLDASNLKAAVQVRTSENLLTTVRDAQGQTVDRFRARSLSGEHITLAKPVHYGNTGYGFDERKPTDDAYNFKPEVSRMLWSRMRELAERYGYDLRGDPDGALVLTTKHNPYRAHTFSSIGGYTAVSHPSAYGGRYHQTTTGAAFTFQVETSRLDGIFPLGADVARQWTVTVTTDTGTPVAGPLTLTLPESAQPVHYYDLSYSPTTLNSAVVTLFSLAYGRYRVTLTPVGAGTHRINAMLLFFRDPDRPTLASPLSTTVNAERVTSKTTMGDQRNHVTVVGRRIAALTDSEKVKQNPDNPESEFVVQSVSDIGSIVDPTTANYIGYPRESLIFDNQVTDQDYAAWLARTFIYRQSVPLPNAQVSHTFLPSITLSEPVYVVEDRYRTLRGDRALYIQQYTHRWNTRSAMTTVECAGQPEYPSYEPREDVDIDLYFAGLPVVNVDVSYTSLSGDTQSNLGKPLDVVRYHSDADLTTYELGVLTDLAAVTGTPNKYLQLPNDAPWPVVPGTLSLQRFGTYFGETFTVATPDPTEETRAQLRPGDVVTQTVPDIARGGIVSVVLQRWERTRSGGWGPKLASITLTANPTTAAEYYYEVNWTQQLVTVFRKVVTDRSAPAEVVTVRVTYREALVAEPLQTITNTPYHHFYEVDYARKRIYLPWQEGDGEGPHAFNEGLYQSFVVNYRPLLPLSGDYVGGASPFYDPYTSEIGNLVKVQFDSLLSAQYRISIRAYSSTTNSDYVVAWLTEPTAAPDDAEAHWSYAPAAPGQAYYWDGVDQVGMWNRYQSEVFGAIMLGTFEQERQEVVGKGFYAWNAERTEQSLGPLALIDSGVDGIGKPIFGIGPFGVWYVQIEARNDWTAQRTPYVRTVKSSDLNPTFNAGDSSGLIYTHLPAPTQVEATPHDWVDGTYVEGQTYGWYPFPDAEAHIHNTKPFQLSFAVRNRPGVLWTGKHDEVSVKITRVAHLRANIFDQFVSWDGTYYGKSAVERKTVVSRRLTNDDNTWTFSDDNYRKASSFTGPQAATWIFRPQDCKKNFRGQENESLKFGDYLQLEAVPNWNASARIASARSRFQIAFINYLFYLSAYSQDRSGRRMWAINPKFVDRSKITSNEASHWMSSTQPSTWSTGATFNLDHGDIPYLFQRRSIFTRNWSEPGWNGGAARWASPVTTQLSRHTWDAHDPLYNRMTITGLSQDATWANRPVNLGDVKYGLTGFKADTQLPTGGLGAWTWEQGPLWIPSVARDFHPYRILPPLGEYVADGSMPTNADNYFTFTSDADTADVQVWSGAYRDMLGSGGYFDRGFKISDKGENGPNAMDYMRQDETVHYEDVRGSISNGPKPGEGVKVVAPSTPYYQNQYRYHYFQLQSAINTNDRWPKVFTAVDSWFRVNFRHEYLWEAPTFFPVELNGKERTDAFNPWLNRQNATAAIGVRYDNGAFIGWKDDNSAPRLRYKFSAFNNAQKTWDPANPTLRVFSSPWMALAVGPETALSRKALFHLSLVPERRDSAV